MNMGSMNVFVIGDHDTTIGFRLAGVNGTYEAADRSEVEEAMKDIAVKGESSLVIITERLAEMVRGMVNEIQRMKTGEVIIVEIPDRTGRIEGRTDSIRGMIKRMVGVEIE